MKLIQPINFYTTLAEQRARLGSTLKGKGIPYPLVPNSGLFPFIIQVATGDLPNLTSATADIVCVNSGAEIALTIDTDYWILKSTTGTDIAFYKGGDINITIEPLTRGVYYIKFDTGSDEMYSDWFETFEYEAVDYYRDYGIGLREYETDELRIYK